MKKHVLFLFFGCLICSIAIANEKTKTKNNFEPPTLTMCGEVENNSLMTLTATSNGRWDIATTWDPQVVPTAAHHVVIPQGRIVKLLGDCESKTTQVNGALINHQGEYDFHLETDYIMVNGSGAKLAIGIRENTAMGITANPYNGTEGIITLRGPVADTSNSIGTTKFIMAMNGGTIEIQGEPQVTWTELDGNVAPGATQITLLNPVSWPVGAQIVIASSRIDGDEAEQREILAISPNGKTITLDAPLNYPHLGIEKFYSSPAPNSWTVNMRAEVGLLSRNIKIQGDAVSDVNGFGAHIMVMSDVLGTITTSGEAYIDGVELYRMGQEGIVGKYPFHWHMVKNLGAGQYFKNSSVHKSFNRALTIHGTESTLVENNFFYDHIGHGIFLEDGSERYNTIRKNVVLLTKKPFENEVTPSDNQFNQFQNRSPASYWITNPNNIFEDNVAAGTSENGAGNGGTTGAPNLQNSEGAGTGYWFIMPLKPIGVSSTDPYFNDQEPYKEPLGRFKGNKAHSTMSGFDIFDHLDSTHAILNNGGWKNPQDKIMENCTWYANHVGVYSGIGDARSYPDQVKFRNNIFVDNQIAILLASYNQADGSVFVADSGEEIITGDRFMYTTYDGAGKIRDSHLIGWDAPDAFLILESGAATKHVNHRFSDITMDHSGLPNLVYQDCSAPPPGNLTFDHFMHPRFWNNILLDEDGTLTKTGTKTSVVSNHPLHLVGGETKPSNWTNAYISNYEFALSFLTFNGNPSIWPNTSMTRTKVGTPRAGAYFIDGYMEKQQLPVIVNDDFLYTYYFESLPTDRTVILYMDDANIGDNYLMRFPEFGNFGGLNIIRSNPSINNEPLTRDPLPVFSTLSLLEAANVSGQYIHSNGDLYIRAVARDRTQDFVIQWTQAGIVMPVIDADGDGSSDGFEASMGRDPYDEVDLATQFETDTDFEGWSFNNATGSVTGGAMEGTSTTGDPQIVKTDYNFFSGAIQYILIKMKAPSPKVARLYWERNTDSGFAGTRTIAESYTGNGEWQTLIFDVGSDPNWSDRITAMRFDPHNTTNFDFEIEWIVASDGNADNDSFADDVDACPLLYNEPLFTPDHNNFCVTETNATIATPAPIGGWWTGPGTTGTKLFINCGGTAINYENINWQADQYYTLGALGSSNKEIDNTTSLEIYQTERWRGGVLNYDIPVTNGTYLVQLYFAETYIPNQVVGTRTFDIKLEGDVVESTMDIFNEAGANTALIKSYFISVEDGNIDLDLEGIAGNPKVNGIAILPQIVAPSSLGTGTHDITYNFVDPVTGCYDTQTATITVHAAPATPTVAPPQAVCDMSQSITLTETPDGGVWSGPGIIGAPIYVNSGGPDYTEDGITWLADQHFINGSTSNFNPIAGIGSTSNQDLYKTERWRNGNLNYAVSVPNGDYQIEIHFAEMYPQYFANNNRVFNIQLEGTTVQTGMDVYAQAGAETALIKSYEVTVVDGTLNLDLIKNIAQPKISGFAILPKTFDPSTAGTGTHTLTYNYTDPLSGCSNTKTTTITVAAPPVATANGNNTICVGESSQLAGTSSGSGAKTYKWYVAGTNTLVSSAQNPTVIPSTTTAYELITTASVSGASNCTSNRSAPVTITVNPLPATPTISAAQTVCELSTTILTASPVGGVWSGTGIIGSPIYINAGGPAVAEEGISWLADQYFVNGSTSNFGGPSIANTAGQSVYQTERWSSGNLFYDIPLANGEYQVQVHFAELHAPSQTVGGRVFNILLEGTVAENNVDIFDEVGGATALIKTYTVNVSDGTLDLDFIRNPSNPKVSAISILPKSFDAQTAGPGTYSLDYNYIDPTTGCSKSNMTAITVAAAPVASIAGSVTICEGESATLNGAVTGTGNKSYRWYVVGSNGVVSQQQNITVTPTQTTNYVVYGIVNGCWSYVSSPVTVTVNPNPVTPTVTTGQTVCQRGPHKILTATPVGGVWSGTGIVGSPIYINAGGPALTEEGISWSADQSFVNGSVTNFGNTSIANTAGQSIYQTERWSSGNLLYEIPVTSGEYQVQLHFAETYMPSQTVGARIFNIELEGTVAEANIDIFDEAGPATALIKTYSVNVTDGVLDLDFIRNPDNPKVCGISILPKGFNAEVAGPGTHVLTYDYIDPLTGCENSTTSTYTVTQPPVATTSGNTSICLGESATLGGIASGSGTTSYRWYENGVSGLISQQQNFVVSPTQTTDYRLIVVVNGCWSYASAWTTVTVNQPPAPPTVSGAQTLCQRGGAVSLTATPTGGTWAGSGITGNSFNPTTAGPGVHTLTYDYTDSNGCSSLNTTNFTVEAAPVASVSGSTTICEGSSASLTASATGTGTKVYTWYVSGTNTAIFQGQTYTVSPTQTTSYDILANVGGCLSYRSAAVTVTVNSLPAAPTVSSPQTLCERGNTISLTASPSGGVWAGSGTSGSSFNPTTAGPGPHTLTYTYTNANNCSSSNTTQFTVTPAPIANATASSTSICAGREIMLNGSSPTSGTSYNYQWYLAGTNTQVSTQQNPMVTPTVDTDYKMIVTVDGCASYPSSTLTVNVDPSDAVCFQANTMLEGPFASGVMIDNLKENGFLVLTEPYTALGYAGLTNSGIVVPNSVLTGAGANNDIVDWVVVQLRDKNNPLTIVASAAMLLEQDGEIITYEQGRKSNILSFQVPHDDYYLAIFHRNHLPVMTANPIAFSGISSIFDFTSNGMSTYGTGARIQLATGTWGMITGDASSDNSIDAQDRSETWNNRNQSGYMLPDVTLDGDVNAADRSKTWNNRNKNGTID